MKPCRVLSGMVGPELRKAVERQRSADAAQALAEHRMSRAMSAAKQVETETGLPAIVILSRCREPDIVAARYRVIQILHDSGMPMAAIGRCLRMHHTSVMHGLRKCKERGS